MTWDDTTGVTRCEGTVLIVDDDEDIREMLRDFLEGEGFRVAVAEHGARALAVLKQVDACFILFDLMMPVMDGWEFLRERQKDPAAHRIPLWISTSAPEKAPPGFCIIPKPVDISKILDAVRAHC